jgi:PAS domain-containing protein
MKELWLLTETDGRIVEASTAATEAIRLSITRVVGRNALVFFQRDRSRIALELRRAALGLFASSFNVSLRPRDRRPVSMLLTLDPTTDGRVRWSLLPATEMTAD